MKIIPIEHGLDLAPATVGRSKGLHMSELYTHWHAKLEPERFVHDEDDDGPSPVLLMLGLALEQYIERCLVASGIDAHRPDEFRTEEGIAFSPDLLIYNGEFRVGEIKLTYMSCRDVPTNEYGSFPPKFDKYFTQLKCYCRALGTPYARLYVCFVCGNYVRPFTPEFRAWDLEFTQHELDENWRIMLAMMGEL